MISQGPQIISQLEEPVATFYCSAFGIPLPTIMWSFNNNGVASALENTDLVVESRNVTAQLRLTEVMDDQFGTYSCGATNMFGSDDASANLSSRKFCPKLMLNYVIR